MYKYKFGEQTIYRFVYEFIDSNMYLILEDNKAIVVDPHKSDKLKEILKYNKISNIDILLTHEHPDHISGLPWLVEEYSTTIICQENCAKTISEKKSTRPLLMTFVLEERDRINGTNLLEKFNKAYKPFSVEANITYKNDFSYKTKEHNFKFHKISGHSQASCCIIMDNNFLFSGDSLMLENPTITRFPGGSKKDFQNIAIPYFESLDKNLIVFPGHGEIFKLEEKIKEGQLNVAIR